MNKDEMLLEKRFEDLARLSFQKGIITYTDFLNLNELNIFYHAAKKTPFGRTEVFGGYEFSERQMVAFIPDALYYEYEFPIDIVEISPLNMRYSDKLTHRDYLGAILNLGIDRSKIGDILQSGGSAYVFCHRNMSSFLISELTKVKHTNVSLKLTDRHAFQYSPEYERITGTVASVRLDSLLAKAFHASRSKLSDAVRSGRVFVNGRLILSGSYEPKTDDVISVRGLGKFCFRGTGEGTSKKGRLYITIDKYK